MIQDFESICPIKFIDENCYIAYNGDVTVGFSVFLPEVYTLSEDQARTLHLMENNLFKRLPKNVVLHMQNFYYVEPYTSAFLENETSTSKALLNEIEGTNVCRHYANYYLTFVLNPSSRVQLSSKNNSYINPQSLKSIFTNILKSNKDFKETITNTTNAFIASVNALDFISIKRLTDNQLGCALVDYYNLSYKDPSTTFLDKEIQPVSFKNGQLIIGDQYVSVLSLKIESPEVYIFDKYSTTPGANYANIDSIDYSGKIDFKTSHTFPIGLGLPIDHILNVSVEILDNDDCIKKMSSLTGLRFLSSMRIAPAAGTKINAIETFQKQVLEQNYQICRTTINVILHDVDLNKLKEKIALTEIAFGNMKGAICWKENEGLANLFFASSPGNFANNYRGFLNVTNQASCYFPKETNYLSDALGFTFFDRISGAPTVVDTWNMKDRKGKPRISNRNKMIFGPSGTGKSYLINIMMDALVRMSHHIIIVDVGKSYKKLVDTYKGVEYDASNIKNFAFNIFINCPKTSDGRYIYKVADDDGEGANDNINSIYTILAYIWFGSSTPAQETKQILVLTIEKYYNYVNEKRIFPNLIEYNTYLDIFMEKEFKPEWKRYFDVESLKLLLIPYVSGEYKFLLNSDKNLNLTNEPLIYFDLEAIKNNENLLNLITILVINLVFNKINNLPLSIKKSLYIDEAVDFFTSDMGDFIAYLYRTFRKKNGEVAIATQNVKFLKTATSIVQDSLKSNSDTLILLDHSKEGEPAYRDLQEHLGLTNHDIELMRSITNDAYYREVFFKMGKQTKVYRIKTSPLGHAVYTSDADDNSEIYRLYDIYGSFPRALSQFVENNKLKTK